LGVPDDQRTVRKIQLPRNEGYSSTTVSPFAAELNEQQLAAVTAPDGPVLVLAGAGSGKTRVITYRVAHLVMSGVRPWQIMLTTFTNKAAREMLHRVENLIGPAAREVASGTFHHLANLLLRRYGKALGYDSNFTILDESDARSVMKLCRSEAGVDKSDKVFPSERVLVDLASAVVNTNTALDTLIVRRFPHLFDQFEGIEAVIRAYHARKRSSNQMDYDDLLVNWHKLLHEPEHGEVRAALAARYRHILVDEYQDVNHMQAEIVRGLYEGIDKSWQQTAKPELPRYDPDMVPPPLQEDMGTGGRATGSTARATESETPGAGAEVRHADRGLFVVGDDAQSIYSFRGADYSNIRSFPKHFPGATVFKLEVNYRSVPQVLRLANCLLDEADPQFRKELTPVRPAAEEPPLLLACRDADEQASFVAGQLHQLREESGLAWRQMAVLYRAHSNRLEVELELTKRGIPFIVRGGQRFFEQAHIKDLLAYLIVLANGRDEIAWQRLLEMQPRVGTKTAGDVIRKLRGSADSAGGPLGKFIHNGVVESVRGQAKGSLGELQRFLRELEPQALTAPPAGMIEQIIERRFREYLEFKWDNWRQRLEDLEQLVVYAQRHESLPALLAEVGLSGTFAGQNVATADALDDPEEGAVTLSTIHQAKGLEWTAVFVIHVQDEVIPHRLARLDAERAGQLSSAALGEDVWDTPLDEERRLLYVAVTRAEETLYLSYPQLTQGRDFQRIINRPSRFLAGLPGDAYDEAVLDWA
jgi:DNA helicase-2/ATP-dependent DNA helicase PcrA